MIIVEQVEQATPQLAINLGKIMPFLSDEHDGSPINLDCLMSTVASLDSEQLVARVVDPETEGEHELLSRYKIIGAATVSTMHGATGEKAWLEDFVVVPDAKALGVYGVAQNIWDGITQWRLENSLFQMRFNSTTDRVRAHGFYNKNGCKVLATGMTTLFVHNLEKPTS